MTKKQLKILEKIGTVHKHGLELYTLNYDYGDFCRIARATFDAARRELKNKPDYLKTIYRMQYLDDLQTVLNKIIKKEKK